MYRNVFRYLLSSIFRVSLRHRLDHRRPVRTADGTLAAIIGITGPVDALTDAQIAHLIPKIRCAAATLGARIPTTG